MLAEHRTWLEERRRAARRSSSATGSTTRTRWRRRPRTASVLLRGGELAARIERFPALELRKGGDGGPYDEPYDPRELMVLRRSEYAQITRPRGVRRIGIKLRAGAAVRDRAAGSDQGRAQRARGARDDPPLPCLSAMNARVVSVNVGRPAPLSTGKRVVQSAIGKQPVYGPVAARGVNLEGDDQADRSVHGGPDQAVYAYASEDAAWWGEQLGRELGRAGGYSARTSRSRASTSPAPASASAGGSAASSCGSPARASPASSSRRASACRASRGRSSTPAAAARTSRSRRRACCRRATRSRSSTAPITASRPRWSWRRCGSTARGWPRSSPPCPDMLPKLAQWYAELKERAA